MRPLQNVVDQMKATQAQAIAQQALRARLNRISLVIIVLSIASIVSGAALTWGWTAGLFSLGVCVFPIGVLLGISNSE